MVRAFSFLFACSLLADAPMNPDVEGAQTFNQSLSVLKEELSSQFGRANTLTESGATEEEYKDLIVAVSSIREKIRCLEETWRRTAVGEISRADEPYAMWDVGETSLSQLVIEYGANDFLYVIPQELSSMKISLYSGIPLPQESWEEMIEMILAQNGIGVKRINPFVKQLYIFKLDPSAVEAVIAKESDLQLFAPQTRLFYVFSPPPEDWHAGCGKTVGSCFFECDSKKPSCLLSHECRRACHFSTSARHCVSRRERNR